MKKPKVFETLNFADMEWDWVHVVVWINPDGNRATSKKVFDAIGKPHVIYPAAKAAAEQGVVGISNVKTEGYYHTSYEGLIRYDWEDWSLARENARQVSIVVPVTYEVDDIGKALKEAQSAYFIVESNFMVNLSNGMDMREEAQAILAKRAAEIHDHKRGVFVNVLSRWQDKQWMLEGDD